jgi:MFS family permease
MTASAFARLILPDVRRLPRAFWLLFSAALIDRVGGFAVPYLAIFLIDKGGFTVTGAGVVMTLFSVGGLVGTPTGGFIADRFGRKPVLLTSYALTATSWLLVAAASTPNHITIAVALAGMSSSLGRPALTAAIADVVDEADRRRAFGLHYWAVNLGFGVAASLAGMVSNVSWSVVFVIDAASALVAASLLATAMRDVRPSGPRTAVRLIDVVDEPLRDPVFRWLVLEGLLIAALFNQCGLTLAAEMRRDGLASAYGPLVAINGLLIVLFQPTVTQVTATMRAPRVLGTGVLFVGVGFGLVAWCDTAWQYALSIAVWSAGEILFVSAMPSAITRLSPPHLRATYQGLYQMSWAAAAFSPALGAWVLDHAGPDTLWGGCVVVGLLGAWVQARLDREPRLQVSSSSSES